MSTLNKDKGQIFSTIVLAVSLLLSLILAGCSDDIQDLRDYATEVKARRPSGIDPMPEERPYIAFAYPEENTRSPFNSEAIASNPDFQLLGDPGLQPDPDHVAEFLESYPLDTLRMVGTLQQEHFIWALIKTPDRTIQRVTVGNFVGQNYGEIVAISETGVDIDELVPNGLGGYMRRDSAIALSE